MLQTPNTADQINSVIDHLASKLAVPASQLYNILCVQARIELVQSALYVVLMGVVFALLFRALRPLITDDSDIAVPVGMATAVAGIIAVICAAHFVTAIGYALNPPYYAVHTILNALK